MVLAGINTQVLYGTSNKSDDFAHKFCVLLTIWAACDHDLTVNVKLIYSECSSIFDNIENVKQS